MNNDYNNFSVLPIVDVQTGHLMQIQGQGFRNS